MLNDVKDLILKEREVFEKLRNSKDNKKKELLSKFKKLNDKMPSLLKSLSYEEKFESKKKSNDKEDLEETSEKKIPIKSSSLVRISNKIFRKKSEKVAHNFEWLEKDLKKANLSYGLTSYLSMTFFVTFLTFIISFALAGLLIYLKIVSWPSLWAPLVIIGVVYLLFMKSPSSQARDIQKEIEYELPFATLHMAAIAGSKIEPVRLLTIISESDEYLSLGKEIKKILVQVKLYGYDLVTSLRNVAGRTSNKKLSELFSGIATNISSGGSLKNYLEKKADSFLLDYQLERKKYIEMSGTFMDIYISILIAAPLILMLLFVVMSVANLSVGGMSLSVLLFLTVGIVVLFNIIFIVILNLKQPKL